MQLKKLMVALFAVGLLVSCSSDDDSNDPLANFYADAKTSATMDQIVGTWAIYKVSFQDLVAPVPINFPSCGRDFMMFSQDAVYSEYLIKSSDCKFEQNTLNWSLKNGVITLSDTYNQFEELVLTQVSPNELVVKTRLDVDEDGKLDVVYAYFQRYTPLKFDVVSNTFARNTNTEKSHLISYTWQPYHDPNTFVAYEIYRSVGESCSKNQAVLVKSITDITTTEFTDHTPPGEAQLCYYLKTKIRSGTLGESEIQWLYTYTLAVKPVNLAEPVVQGNAINFNWEESDTPYFSHYEITYSNFPGNITGYGQQVVPVVKIYDKKVTHFREDHPPYLENPNYYLRVYNIFGTSTDVYSQDHKSSWKVEFQPTGLLPLYSIISYAMDATEPVIYLYGYESENSYEPKVLRYNYETQTTEAISSHPATTSTDLPIEFMTSSEGDELILEQGNELQIYDAKTLIFKYLLKPSEVRGLNDFQYTSAGYWIITDGDYMRSYKRSGSMFTLIDEKPHFSDHQGFYNYSVHEIEDHQLLLGHKQEANSMVYKLNGDGQLTFLKTVEIPIKDFGVRQAQYNQEGHFIINLEDRRLYSTLDFSYLESILQPLVISGTSKDGRKIYGSNNDPDWHIQDSSPHLKEAIIYNRNTKQTQTVPAIGYPMFVFQSPSGTVYSLSSGLKRSKLKDRISYTKDLFIEQLEIP